MNTFLYQITRDDRLPMIRIGCKGTLELEVARRMVSEARAIAIRHQFSLLYDFRRLLLPPHVPLGIVLTFPITAGLPQQQEALRSAAVIATDQNGHEVWEAYRLASRQSGMHWNYFIEESAAISWLQRRNHWDIRRGRSELKLG